MAPVRSPSDEPFVSVTHDELQQLYCDFRQQLFTCALVITGVPARAEDAVHDAFCQLLQTRSDPTDVKAYVFRAVRNAALQQLRRDPGLSEPLPDVVFDQTASGGTLAELAEFEREVITLMKRLSDDERETIVQHLYGELTFQQVSAIRGRPLGTVVSWYRRGLDKLRRELELVDGSI